MDERKSIPLSWLFNYINAFPDDSLQRRALIDMFIQWAKEQEQTE